MRPKLPRSALALPVLLAGLALPLQALASPGFTLKGGLVASDFAAFGVGSGGVAVDSFGATAFGLGAATRIELPGRFALQVEALWLRKVADIAIGVEPFPAFGLGFTTVRARVDYLEIPLMLRWELRAGGARPYLLGGPAVALRLGSALSGPGFGRLIESDLVVPDLAGRMHRTDLVLGFGAGVDFDADRDRGWNVELRASWGLTGLFGELPDAPVRTVIDAETRAFAALLGYRF